MHDKLLVCINQNNEKITNDYNINSIDDLFDKKKINFYYFFLIYILKSSLYIYNVPFLNRIRKKVLKIVKTKSNSLRKKLDGENKENKVKIINILKKFLDVEFYYFEKFINCNNDDIEDYSYIGIIRNKSSENINNFSNISNLSEINRNNTNTRTNEVGQNSMSLNNCINSISSEIIKVDNSESNYNYQIIELKKIFGKHIKTAEYIIETKKGYLISCGSENILSIYQQCEKKLDIKIPIEYTGWPFNIYEKENNQNILELRACTKVGRFIITIAENNGSFTHNIKLETQKEETCFFYFDMENNDYIIGGEKGIKLFNSSRKLKQNIDQKSFRGAIKIDKNLLAFTSNHNLPKGEDKLIIYNYKTNKIDREIKNYSFTQSSSNLTLMIFEKTKILICGCKKYNKGNYDNYEQKNGILLINLNTYQEEFFETDNFEVYCFCNINKTEINSNDDNNKIKNNFIKTNYFFVGGFEEKKRCGLIKLYEIIKENDNITIDYIQDIAFSKKEIKIDLENSYSFEGFERNVSSIIQSKFTGELFVSCWDGNIFLFTPPNIDLYLKN